MKAYKVTLIYLLLLVLIWSASIPFISSRLIAFAFSILLAFSLCKSVNAFINSKDTLAARAELKSLTEYLYGSVSAGKTISEAIVSSGKELSIIYGDNSDSVKAVRKFTRSGNIGIPYTKRLSLLAEYFKCPESEIFFEMLASADIVGKDIRIILKQNASMLNDIISTSKDLSAELSQKKTEGAVMSVMPFLIAWNLHVVFPGYFDPVINDPGGQIFFLIIFSICVLCLSSIVKMIGDINSSRFFQRKTNSKRPFRKLCILIHNSEKSVLKQIKTIFTSLLKRSSFKFIHSSLRDLKYVSDTDSDYTLEYFIVKLSISVILLIVLPLFIVSGISPWIWFLFLVSALIAHDIDIRRKADDLRRIRAFEFPSFIGLLETLLSCGLSVPQAVLKCSEIYKRNNSPLSEELSVLSSGLISGKPVAYVLENFAILMDSPEISSALLLAARYHITGNPDTLSLLGLHRASCLNLAKSASRIQTDSVAFKLLLPMLLQFISVALISVLPALLSSGII